MDLKDKKVSVIGMARTGIATAHFLLKQGAVVTLSDSKSEPELKEVMDRIDPSVEIRFQSSAPAPDADLVVLSPGVDIGSPELEGARQRGAEIISELELACRLTTVPIIAVTGTNGKTTTTSLIGSILKKAGKDIQIGGNIGIPFVSLLEQPPKDFMVIEVSSFQLEGTAQFRPKIGLLLNLTPDHLDRHDNMAHYAALKRKIAENQTAGDHLVMNADDPWVLRMAQGTASRQWQFSVQKELEEGAFLKNGNIVLRRDQKNLPLCSVNELQQAMQWQIENILAASLAANLAGVGPENIAEALKEFSGLEHRMEWVRDVEGVDYINDSKGTNIGAVEKSLESMSRPIILIMGGQDKGADFVALSDLLKQKVKHLVLIGEARGKIKTTLNGSFSYEEAETLEDAVQQARARAKSGDVVLLSPGCASFDMFRDYIDRGNQFKEIVHCL